MASSIRLEIGGVVAEHTFNVTDAGALSALNDFRDEAGAPGASDQQVVNQLLLRFVQQMRAGSRNARHQRALVDLPPGPLDD